MPRGSAHRGIMIVQQYHFGKNVYALADAGTLGSVVKLLEKQYYLIHQCPSIKLFNAPHISETQKLND